MCGRAYLTYSEEEIRIIPGLNAPLPDLPTSYNFAPPQSCPIILASEDPNSLKVEIMSWGLIPHWSKKEDIRFKTINARSESIESKPSFKEAFQKRRCLVPISGYYEWTKAGAKKIPHVIRAKDAKPLFLAGVHDSWTHPKTRESLATFSIVTREAIAPLDQVHSRMPLIFDNEVQQLQWLNGNTKEAQTLLSFKPNTDFEVFEVSTEVNSVHNNHPRLIQRTQERLLL